MFIVQCATIVQVIMRGYNWYFLQPGPLNCHTRVQIASREVTDQPWFHTKMLSFNNAEKLSGPWLLFWFLYILCIFLVAPCEGAVFIFYGFFGAPCMVAKRSFEYFFGAPCKVAKRDFRIFLVCQAICLTWVFNF